MKLGTKHSEEAKAKMRSRKITKETRLLLSKKKQGKNNHRWTGGRVIHKGYVYLYTPDHPFRNYHNKVKEHRLVMEKHIERYLTKEEVVHHINEDKQDNRIENLMLFANDNLHKAWHVELRKEKKCQNIN